MEPANIPRLRVLVSDGPGVRLDEVTRTVARLGHDVIARESSLPDVARITAIERPDVALVIVHEATAKALQLIDRIVHDEIGPVMVEQVLAVRLHRLDRGPDGWLRADEALGLEGDDRFSHQHRAQDRRAPMDRVPLGHVRIVRVIHPGSADRDL